MREIAKATPRLVALSLGAEDFALAVGMEPIGETLQAPKQTMIIAARAAGILPLGFMGTVADFHDLEAFRARWCAGRAGSASPAASCIHPSQVRDPQRGVRLVAPRRSTARDAWSPPTTTRMADGVGAVTFEGKMIDVPVVERERALLRQAERFATRRSK